jgi:hypothetical protein
MVFDEKEKIMDFKIVDGYRFLVQYYTGEKKNGEKFSRDWILYSVKSTSVFCLPCCIYGSTLTAWSNYGVGNVGFRDFHHCLRGIIRHEESIHHMENVRKWKLNKKNISDPNSVVSISKTAFNQNVSNCRLILRGILDAVLFLAQNNLAFLGSHHNINEPNCGNFLSVIKLLSKYYPPLADHVDKLSKNSASYLSPQSQNEFISLCGSHVRKYVLSAIQERKYYSILFDSTPDTSHRDQISQIIRTVHCTIHGCEIKEDFVDFITSTEKTGLGLSLVILKKLERDGLSLSDCRGQGYDNGANMAGNYSGVQSRILEVNPAAKFLPCAAHSENRVGVNAADKVPEAKLILGQIQNLFVFFSLSTSRWHILTSKTKLTLKGQSDTRWSAKAAAVSALWNEYSNVVDVLTEISISDQFSSDVAAAAYSRLKDMLNYKFLLGLTIWNQLLFQINLTNVSLQGRQMDVSRAEKKLSILVEFLKDFKKTGFKDSQQLCYQMAEEIGIDISSGFDDVRRGRGLNRRHMDLEDFEALNRLTNMERFEQEFFDKLLDQLLIEMEKRFYEFKEAHDDFGFLWGDRLKSFSASDQQKYVQDLCLKYPNDLNPFSFYNELRTLRKTVETFQDKDISILGPMDILNVIYCNELQTNYCNSEIALRIFLTLPVTVASNERSFSKLKIIKNFLRSTMSQDRLTNLAILSIEKEVTKTIDFDVIIDQFASRKCRRIPID